MVFLYRSALFRGFTVSRMPREEKQNSVYMDEYPVDGGRLRMSSLEDPELYYFLLSAGGEGTRRMGVVMGIRQHYVKQFFARWKTEKNDSYIAIILLKGVQNYKIC